MKRTLALLFSALMLTGVLSGCGTATKTDTTSGSGTTTDGSTASGSTGTTTSGTTSSAKTTAVKPGGTTATSNANAVGNGQTVAPKRTSGMTAGTTSTANTTNQSAVIRGATYGQMLRNGRVHDTNGVLTDGENAVTPGTATY